MGETGHETHEVTGRQGVVFIAGDPDPEGSRVVFGGYWDGGGRVLERMPPLDRVADAIR